MCMCGKPTLNGEPGYSWNGETPHVRPINAPDLRDGDELLYDEPGRCGGLDSHSHHLRVVRARYGGRVLLIRHGGGDEAINLGVVRTGIDALTTLDSSARYWLLLTLYHVHREALKRAHEDTALTYRTAFVEGRLKKRKLRGRDAYKVTITIS